MISEKELKKALAATKKDFPQGIQAIGADALRLGLCSYDIKSTLFSLMTYLLVKKDS